MSTQSNLEHLQNCRHVDRISYLPDEILCHILSFIPTKFAVVTSTLSKRWKYLWTKVPVIDIIGTPYFPHFGSIDLGSFRNVVDRVLLYNNTPCLQHFRLEIRSTISVFHLKSWLSSIAKRGVRKLRVTHCMYCTAHVPLPSGFLCSEKLVELELCGKFSISWPMPLHLTNLEVIRFTNLQLPDDEFLKGLSLSCPVLRELRITNCDGIDRILHVESSSLEKLEISDYVSMSPPVDCIIRAPNLRQLEMSGVLAPFDISNLSLLVEANIDDLRYVGSEHWEKILEKIYGVKTARLDLPRFIGREYKIPIFPNLTYLELYSSGTLGEFLCCAPNLKHLMIKHLLEPPTLTYWPESLSSLEKFELYTSGYIEEQVALESLVAEFLKVASALKEMKVSMFRSEKNQLTLFRQKILALPRSSASCQVEVVSC